MVFATADKRTGGHQGKLSRDDIMSLLFASGLKDSVADALAGRIVGKTNRDNAVDFQELAHLLSSDYYELEDLFDDKHGVPERTDAIQPHKLSREYLRHALSKDTDEEFSGGGVGPLRAPSGGGGVEMGVRPARLKQYITLRVKVPPGGPGNEIRVQAPDGRMVPVQVPRAAPVGGFIDVQIEAFQTAGI